MIAVSHIPHFYARFHHSESTIVTVLPWIVISLYTIQPLAPRLKPTFLDRVSIRLLLQDCELHRTK